ncbi:MAG: DUF503 domain-containing protein [Candidatus Xenobiia bacterium LiM19]
MYVALCRLELFLLDEPNSLKGKRHVVRSIKERIRNRFGASVAEVDDHDKWQRATLGIAYVTRERIDAEDVIMKIFGFIEGDGTVEVIDKYLEYQSI